MATADQGRMGADRDLFRFELRVLVLSCLPPPPLFSRKVFYPDTLALDLPKAVLVKYSF